VDKIETMEDRTLKLRVYTQEINPVDEALIFQLRNKVGWFLFSEQVFSKEDVLDLPEIKLEKGRKSEAQRLRAVLYLLWQKGSKKVSSDDHYKEYINRLIDRLKEGL